MVLAKLTSGITEWLQCFSNCDISFLQTHWSTRRADFGEARAQAALAGDKRGAPGGATVLAVIIGEHGAFFGNPVDVRGVIAHQPTRVHAQVRYSDVVAKNDENVRPFRRLRQGTRR